ncbi:MAG: nucleotide sugar dehydrogenase [Patescibacteria group bacterium]
MVKNKQLKKEVITIVGIGYVGLPLACLCGEKGYKTFGIGKDRKKVSQINKGISPISGDAELSRLVSLKSFTATMSFDCIKKSDIVVVCVPTPVDDQYNPDLTPVISATKNIAKRLKNGQLIILESTVNPGVCEEVMLPLLEKISKKKVGKDFFLAHCPERINPGDPKWNVRNIPRCVGATDPKGLHRAVKFYRSIISGEIRPMKSVKEAEATKIIENAFRDVNIAFVNELAKSFEKLGIDLIDVIGGASTKPFAFMPHWPGVGVGGHCIAVDPYYLIERAKLAGFNHSFLKLAREINNSMPAYAVERLQDALNEAGMPLKGTRVGVMGLSYKPNVGDIRESPAIKVIELLQKKGAVVDVFDPYFPDKSTVVDLESLLKKVDALLLVTGHREFKIIPASILKKNRIKVIVDGRNCLDKDAILKKKIIYKGIGR